MWNCCFFKPWQQVSFCFFANFEKHCFNISKDILYSVVYGLGCGPNDIITFLICIIQNVNISKTKKDIPKKESWFFFLFFVFL